MIVKVENSDDNLYFSYGESLMKYTGRCQSVRMTLTSRASEFAETHT
jgi:hypothetical protein